MFLLARSMVVDLTKDEPVRFPFPCTKVVIDLTKDYNAEAESKDEGAQVSVGVDVDVGVHLSLVQIIDRFRHLDKWKHILPCIRSVESEGSDPELSDSWFGFRDGSHFYCLRYITEGREFSRTECGGRVMLEGGEKPYRVPLRSRSSGYFLGDIGDNATV